jgi:hypothetical protein
MAESYGASVSLVDDTKSHPYRSKPRVLIRGSIEKDNIAALEDRKQSTNNSTAVREPSDNVSVSDTEKQLYRWIQDQYETCAFTSVSFIGWGKFQNALIDQQPQQRDQIISGLQR